MKRLILSLSGLLVLSLGLDAQLRVLSNGHIQAGDWTANSQVVPTSSNSVSPNVVINPGMIPQVNDTTTTISILGTNNKNLSGGTIAFGGRRDVMFQEASFTESSTRKYGSLYMVGKGGIYYNSSDGRIFSYAPPIITTADPVFTFNINVKATAFLTSSDARYKSNVESIENMGPLLDELTPVSYNLNLSSGEEATKKSAASAGSGRRSFGFLAQEVREILPELVYEDEEGMLSVDYTGFIPLLVDAYKDLKATVSEQEKRIAALQGADRKVKSVATVEEMYGESVVLLQNRPNPFRDTTEIRCHIPESIRDAFICIYDLNGRQQNRLPVSDRGEVAVTISANTLQPGIYLYSLIVDGNEADTKRMILTE